jgi:hypothetical protein
MGIEDCYKDIFLGEYLSGTKNLIGYLRFFSHFAIVNTSCKLNTNLNGLYRRCRKMFGKCVIIGLCLTVSATFAQQSDQVNLGRLQTGATVSFIRSAQGQWGIEISSGSTPTFTQPKPAYIEVFKGQENVQQLATGYQSLRKESDAVVATAKITSGGEATFEVEDQWKVSGDVLLLNRKVSVTSAEDDSGFYSAIRLSTAPIVKWEDVNCLVPGLLYGDSSYAGGRAPTGISNYRAKCFEIREDYMSAPLFGVLFRDGSWAAVLDMAPLPKRKLPQRQQHRLLMNAFSSGLWV